MELPPVGSHPYLSTSFECKTPCESHGDFVLRRRKKYGIKSKAKSRGIGREMR